MQKIIRVFHQFITILLPVHVLVRLIYRTRRYLYTVNHYKTTDFYPRTISVGNIVMGGSGKTPFLKWILKNLPQKCCVLISSRGHKSKSETIGKIINSGERFSAKEIGDENIEILRSLKNGTIAVGKNRVEQISKCIRDKSFSYLFLDDGFQHMKIGRDINVVLFNSLLEYEKLKVFPRGYLREGVGSLYEADIIIFTNCSGEKFSRNEAAIRNIISPFLS